MSDTTLMECQTCHIETDCIEGICEECRLMNKENLEEHAQEEKNQTARDDEYEEGSEADRVAEFENTRGTDKPSKYFNN